MGSPKRKAAASLAGRAALIAAMLGSGLMFAAIAQAQDIGAADRAERAASQAPPPLRLIPFAPTGLASEPR